MKVLITLLSPMILQVGPMLTVRRGDAGPRAVAAMAAAVAFDAVARQPTENVTSLLSQATDVSVGIGVENEAQSVPVRVVDLHHPVLSFLDRPWARDFASGQGPL